MHFTSDIKEKESETSFCQNWKCKEIPAPFLPPTPVESDGTKNKNPGKKRQKHKTEIREDEKIGEDKSKVEGRVEKVECGQRGGGEHGQGVPKGGGRRARWEGQAATTPSCRFELAEEDEFNPNWWVVLIRVTE